MVNLKETNETKTASFSFFFFTVGGNWSTRGKNQGVEAKPVIQQARVRYNLDRSLVTETNNQTPTILSSANPITQNLIIILHQSYNPF